MCILPSSAFTKCLLDLKEILQNLFQILPDWTYKMKQNQHENKIFPDDLLFLTLEACCSENINYKLNHPTTAELANLSISNPVILTFQVSIREQNMVAAFILWIAMQECILMRVNEIRRSWRTRCNRAEI